jgi:hypothetical protein
MSLATKNVSPFTGVEFDQTITLNGRTFRVLTYQAYNAFGLIGPEKNGIAILNDDDRDVVMDEHFRQSSGYFGVGAKVVAEAKRICAMGWEEFQALCNNSPRSRYAI